MKRRAVRVGILSSIPYCAWLGAGLRGLKPAEYRGDRRNTQVGYCPDVREKVKHEEAAVEGRSLQRGTGTREVQREVCRLRRCMVGRKGARSSANLEGREGFSLNGRNL